MHIGSISCCPEGHITEISATDAKPGFYFRYLLARLSAKDGSIINTFIKISLISISLTLESGLSGPEAVRTNNIPRIPKVTEAQINTRVTIFCIFLVYQNKNTPQPVKCKRWVVNPVA